MIVNDRIKLIAVSLWPCLIVSGIALADIAQVKKLLFDMQCEVGAADTSWNAEVEMAYERLMRETDLPFYDCLPECAEPVEELLEAAKANDARCGSSESYDASAGNTSPNSVAFNEIVNSCDPWSMEAKTTFRKLDRHHIWEHAVLSIGSGDELVTHNVFYFYLAVRPKGTAAIYTVSYDTRAIVRTRVRFSEVDVSYYMGSVGEDAHFLVLKCKDDSRCIELNWDAHPDERAGKGLQSESRATPLFLSSQQIPVCTRELALDAIDVVNAR